MRVIVFDAGSRVGARVTEELVRRGHRVTGVVRRPVSAAPPGSPVRFVRGDLRDRATVSAVLPGHDAAVSAIGRPGRGRGTDLNAATSTLLEGLREARGPRVLVVEERGWAPAKRSTGGEAVPERAAEAPGAPARSTFDLLREEQEVDWTYVCPEGPVADGKRTGGYHTGIDPHGGGPPARTLSLADLAVAVADELESPRHARRRLLVSAVEPSTGSSRDRAPR